MKTLLTFIMLTMRLVMALPSSPLRADTAEVIEMEERELVNDEPNKKFKKKKKAKRRKTTILNWRKHTRNM